MKTRSLESLLSKYREKRIWLYLEDDQTKNEFIRQFCSLNGMISYDGEVFTNVDLGNQEHDKINLVDGRILYVYSCQKNTGCIKNVVYINFKKYLNNEKKFSYIVSKKETHDQLCNFSNGIKYI